MIITFLEFIIHKNNFVVSASVCVDTLTSLTCIQAENEVKNVFRNKIMTMLPDPMSSLLQRGRCDNLTFPLLACKYRLYKDTLIVFPVSSDPFSVWCTDYPTYEVTINEIIGLFAPRTFVYLFPLQEIDWKSFDICLHWCYRKVNGCFFWKEDFFYSYQN